jgi:hypothetical protein
MSENRTLHASGPADLLALVPRLIGFHPEDSVVVLTVGPAGEPFHARVDLPPDPRGLADLADYLVEVAVRHRVSRLAAVVYTDEQLLAEEFADRLLARLEGGGPPEVVCAVRADGRRWWWLPAPHGAHPDAGTPYDVSSHPLMAEAVLDGTVVLGSRAELEDSLRCADPEELGRVARAAADVAHRLAGAARPPFGAPAARHHLITEGRWVRRRVRTFLADGRRLDTHDAARLLVLTSVSVEVRDVAWAELTHENAGRHVELWIDLVRRAPRELRAAPAGLLGFAAWLSGRGALAWCAVDRALDAQPDDGLAALLSNALAGAVPPSAWQPLAADALTLFTGPGREQRPAAGSGRGAG